MNFRLNALVEPPIGAGPPITTLPLCALAMRPPNRPQNEGEAEVDATMRSPRRKFGAAWPSTAASTVEFRAEQLGLRRTIGTTMACTPCDAHQADVRSGMAAHVPPNFRVAEVMVGSTSAFPSCSSHPSVRSRR